MIRIIEKNPPQSSQRFLSVERLLSGDFYLTVGRVTVGGNYISAGSMLLTPSQVEDLIRFSREELET